MRRARRKAAALGIAFLLAGAPQLISGAKAVETDEAPETGEAVEREKAPPEIDAQIQDLDDPLYSPFTARYILDEVRQLRTDVERQRADMIQRQVQREYEIAKDAASYAKHAVELFFFIITGVTTLLVFLGWNSLRDVRTRVQEVAEARVDSIVQGYAERLDALESDLRGKSLALQDAQADIDLTNEIHSLWLRANQVSTPAAKIAVYDEIMALRPQDTEAMTFKADAALELEEPQWALSLANRALGIQSDNSHALYQRACAYASIGATDEALTDLKDAIDVVETYRAKAASDPAFEALQDDDRFKAVTDTA